MIPDASLPELLNRYAGNLPRYTSYPTAVEFTDARDKTAWQREILRWHRASPISAPIALYLHLPFCRSLCYFCACTKVILKAETEVESYLDCLTTEISSYSGAEITTHPVTQIHLGGGSPSVLTNQQLQRLMGHLRAVFPLLTPNADISIELDPRTSSEQQLVTLRELGFTRLSFGVQDFTPEVQEAIHRVQSYECTAALVAQSRAAGFRGINIDLVYGLPLQTVDNFSETLQRVLDLRPERIALYGYAHVTWLKKVQKTFDETTLPTPATRIALFTVALRILESSGYVHLGMDHFALPDDELARAAARGEMHRNFMGYTTHPSEVLIGLGMSAISSAPNLFAQNYRPLPTYQAAARSDGCALERILPRSPEDRRRSKVIQELMCAGTLTFADHQEKPGQFAEHFAEELSRLRNFEPDGFLIFESDRVSVTPLGRIFLRHIAACFDQYLGKHQEQPKPVFSQAV